MKIDHKAEGQSTVKKDEERPYVEVSTDGAAASSRPSNDQIANLAYALWQERGCPDGSPEDDWYQAESELFNRH